MVTTQAEIDALKIELQTEMQIVKNKAEYDIIAKQIFKYSNGIESQSKVDALRQELHILQKTAEHHESMIERRKEKFAGFIDAIHGMQDEIADSIEYKPDDEMDGSMNDYSEQGFYILYFIV